MSNDDPAFSVDTASSSLTESPTTTTTTTTKRGGEEDQEAEVYKRQKHDDLQSELDRELVDGSSDRSEQVLATTSDGTVTIAAAVDDDGVAVKEDIVPHQSSVLPSTATAVLEQVQDNVHNAGPSNASERPADGRQSPSHQHNDAHPSHNASGKRAADDTDEPDSSAIHDADSTILLHTSDTPDDSFALTDSTSTARQPYSAGDAASIAMTPDASAISAASRTSTGVDAGSGTESGLQDTSIDATATTPSSSSPIVQTRPAPPKKFTSSLSMNKKFLEKFGAVLYMCCIHVDFIVHADPAWLVMANHRY